MEPLVDMWPVWVTSSHNPTHNTGWGQTQAKPHQRNFCGEANLNVKPRGDKKLIILIANKIGLSLRDNTWHTASQVKALKFKGCRNQYGRAALAPHAPTTYQWKMHKAMHQGCCHLLGDPCKGGALPHLRERSLTAQVLNQYTAGEGLSSCLLGSSNVCRKKYLRVNQHRVRVGETWQAPHTYTSIFEQYINQTSNINMKHQIYHRKEF